MIKIHVRLWDGPHWSKYEYMNELYQETWTDISLDGKNNGNLDMIVVQHYVMWNKQSYIEMYTYNTNMIYSLYPNSLQLRLTI